MGDCRHMQAHLTIEAELFDWLVILQNLCVALAHPLNRTSARRIPAQFVRQLGETLVERGALAEVDVRGLWRQAGITDQADVARDEPERCPCCCNTIVPDHPPVP
jgi:hypothetical protein